jgi:hypothetical protein
VLVASNDNYVAVYRSLAFLLPVAMLCLMMSARSRQPAVVSESPLVGEPGV